MATIDEAEGELFRKARDILGYTQKQLAQEAGTDQSTISRLERGDSSGISAARLNAIRTALNLPLPELGPDPKALSLACCKNPRCISHSAIESSGLYLLPHFVQVKSGTTAYCRYCPSALEDSCECKHPMVNGVRCPHCLKFYVDVPREFKEEPDWAEQHNRKLRMMLEQIQGLQAMDTQTIYEVARENAEPVSANKNEGVSSEQEVNLPAGRPE